MTRWLDETLSTPLSSLGIDGLDAPERLPWLLVGITLLALLGFHGRRPALAWPGTPEARQAGGRRREWVPAIAFLLRLATIACLGVVIARPVAIHESPPEPGHGLDIVLVLDTSASMRALDTTAPEADSQAGPRIALENSALDSGSGKTRLDLAKRVVSRFANARVAEGDRVALVVFGTTAFTQCPLTSDGRLLSASLERVEAGVAGEATALGDALALAVKRAPASTTGAGRVVVLLTDGRSNAGRIPVEIAIQLAVAERLRVHTVGIGTGGTEVPMAPRAGRGEQALRFERHDTDPGMLEAIARATGGHSFAATRPGDLAAVYREIDSLERVERRLPPRLRRSLQAEPLLALAGGLLSLEILLAGVVRRRSP